MSRVDPATLSALGNALGPILGALIVCGCPVGILWVLKHHQFRMKELELQEKAFERAPDPRLNEIEQRVASLESALTSRPARAELMEPPENPNPQARTRER
jgi:hypothetical protein